MRKGLDIEKLKEIVTKPYTGYCPVCGEKLNWNWANGIQGQFAHVLSNTKRMKLKYGEEVIRSSFNVAQVCSLECNNSIQLKTESHPIEAVEWADWVRGKNVEF